MSFGKICSATVGRKWLLDTLLSKSGSVFGVRFNRESCSFGEDVDDEFFLLEEFSDFEPDLSTTLLFPFWFSGNLASSAALKNRPPGPRFLLTACLCLDWCNQGY